MRFAIVFFASMILLLTSCKEDEHGTIELVFVPKFGTDDFALHQDYMLSNSSIRLTLFRQYLSPLKLTNIDGESFTLSQVEILDQGTSRLSFSYRVNTGVYDQIELGVGVIPELNSTTPDSYPSDHPLSLNENNYWGMVSKYVFLKLEGFYFVSGAWEPFVYHIGLDDLYRYKTFEMDPFPVEHNQTITKVFEIDVKNVFENGVSDIDIEQESETHTLNNMVLAEKIMDNFLNSISMP